MTIDEAIEIMTDILRFVKPDDPPEEHDAIKLGIEALKRVKSLRLNVNLNLKLPGETEK